MKFLVAGLGNPGEEYSKTRHNVGFMVADLLAEKYQANWEKQKFGLLARIAIKGRQCILLKPDTYMNLSGKAVSYWVQKEKIHQQNLIVVTDDIALPAGTTRLKLKGSNGGHNGLKSIEESLQTSEYPRLRIGVGSDFYPGQQVQYVLSPWTGDDREAMELALQKSVDGIEIFIHAGAGFAMTSLNAKTA